MIFWAKKESLSAPESIKQKIKAFRLFFWEEGPLGGEPNDPVWKKFYWGSQKYFINTSDKFMIYERYEQNVNKKKTKNEIERNYIFETNEILIIV